MNEVYEEYFPMDAQAKATVEVSKLTLGARVEIDLTAALTKKRDSGLGLEFLVLLLERLEAS